MKKPFRTGMLIVCGVSFFLVLGLSIGDLYNRNWNNFVRDAFTALSFAVIWLTWYVLFK